MKGTIFWYVTPCTVVENYRCFGGKAVFAACNLLVASFIYFDLKMEAVRSSEKSVNF
jgi:hypothetical protein